MEMSTSVKIVFVLLSAVHVSLALGRAPWWLSLKPRAACTGPTDIICSDDCTQVLVCLSDGEDGYITQQVAVCASDRRCSAEEQACVLPAESECHPPVRHFTCHAIGNFPDPYNCQRYHVCTNETGESVPEKCDDDSAYNPLRGDCSLTTTDRPCTEGPIPDCSLGKVDVVPENPSIWYICMQKGDEIVPELYKCPGNQVFDKTVGSCVEPSSK